MQARGRSGGLPASAITTPREATPRAVQMACRARRVLSESSPSRTFEAIRIDPRAVTRAACAPESRDYIFLREIEDAATYEIVGGELRIRLRSDPATMKFRAAPPAP